MTGLFLGRTMCWVMRNLGWFGCVKFYFIRILSWWNPRMLVLMLDCLYDLFFWNLNFGSICL